MIQTHFFAPFFALLMILSVLPTSAFADASTTQGHTAYKDQDPRTEIYAVTETPGTDYPNFGAKWEPTSGVYYGRTALGGQTASGYGLANAAANADESLIGFYYGTNDLAGQYDLQYWSYIYGTALKDGEHGLLVYLNFDNEGADCATVTAGTFDSRLISDFTYLSTLSCPVFLRIGGEMNVWGTAASAADYIAAYRHIADLAHTYASNVALVFSPNYSSAYQVDMDSFYPGDNYVDWVGCSLYYNRYHHSLTGQDAFVGVGVYGDPMLNVQQTVNLSKLHNKPIIITEGGSSNSCSGTDNSEWAAERMQKAYSFLPMVYSQIKAIVSSDYGVAWEGTDYTFYNNAVVTAAYSKAVETNPTLLHDYADTASYYTKLSAYTTQWSGTMKLAAYTYASDKLTANWYVDGKWIATCLDYPYFCTIDTGTLSTGSHTIQIKFSNGATKSYSFTTSGYTATPTNDKLYVDGSLQSPSIYKIDGSNYFKLRDVAALLNGTGKQFAVGYDAGAASVTVNTGAPYEMTGTELVGSAGSGTMTAIPSNNTIYVDGVKLDLTVYKIDGSNYFKLRDLGQAIDFYVGYENGNVTVSSTRGYE